MSSPLKAVLYFLVYYHDCSNGFRGYRHTLNGKGNGFYVEPQLAYAAGGANIPQKDTTRFPLLSSGNGYIRHPQLSGPAAILGFGYIFPGKYAFSLGMRYQHIFVIGDPP